MSEPNPAVDALAAYSRLVQFADKLFLATEELDGFGGIAAVAGGWSPAKQEKVAAMLKSARDALNAQLNQLQGLKQRQVRRPER